MKMMNKIFASTVLVAGFAMGSAASAEEFVTIGTGGVTGVYYPTGGAICRLVNASKDESGVRCSVESTGGSVFNINAVRNGELQFGVAQSDVQYNAYKGVADFEADGAFEGLRSVFAIHPEPYTVVARKDADVKNFMDLKGKRFNIGNPGSGQNSTTKVLMEALGWSDDVFAAISELPAGEQSASLCDNNFDAMVYVAGHPSGSISEATSACDSVLVNVDGEAIDKLVADNPYYRKATIPGGMYRGNPDDVVTFGVGATLITSADVSEEAVYTLVKAVFENFDDFKSLHPAFANLKKEEMIKDGLSAPLHAGAIKYYVEAGLMTEEEGKAAAGM